jgi:type III restriction enzyme
MGLALEQGMEESDLGIGNRLTLLDDELRANLTPSSCATVWRLPSRWRTATSPWRWRPAPARPTSICAPSFELHKRYGFTKFVIVVPSVAIKEGVYTVAEIAADHFRGLYANTPFDYFVYDSAKLGQVRNFATSPHIQIMVMTVGAINKFGDEQRGAAEESDEAKRREKSKNVMYRASEKTGGEKPIDLIRATRPILIVDEPQSVDGGLDGRAARRWSDASAVHLRYSATHEDKHHMVLSPGRGRRLRAQAGEADRGGIRHGGGRKQQALRAFSSRQAGTWHGVGAKVELDVPGWWKRPPQRSDRHGRFRPGEDQRARDVQGLLRRRDPAGQG